ncbi:hypothetical protein BaRGS_00011060, partial [Batillaria attramentaria]
AVANKTSASMRAMRPSFSRWWCRVLVMLTLLMAMCLLWLSYDRISKTSFEDYYVHVRDSEKVMMWDGFGPEVGVYNFTVVTAMLDIGRGNWSTQKRSYNTYLLYMHRMLSLDVNMVVFVDPRGRPFVDWMRRGREQRTLVVVTRVEELPYFKHRQRIQEIMDSEEYRRDNELVEKRLCESWVPEYDILQWSKLYFMHEAIRRDPFSNSYFVWLDGGYGHGKDVFPSDGVWQPKNLLEYPDRVTFIERESVETYRQHAARLHKMSINIIAGLFFGGGKRAVERLYALQQDLISDWMKNGVVDDDQTTYMLMYFKEPELFRLVRGDWLDVFKLFHEKSSEERPRTPFRKKSIAEQ